MHHPMLSRATSQPISIGVTHVCVSASSQYAIEPAAAWYLAIFCVGFSARSAENPTRYEEEYRSAEG